MKIFFKFSQIILGAFHLEGLPLLTKFIFYGFRQGGSPIYYKIQWQNRLWPSVICYKCTRVICPLFGFSLRW